MTRLVLPRPAARFRIEPRAPYSLALTAARFARFPERVDRFDGTTYRRLLDVGGELVAVSVVQSGPASRPVLDVRLAGGAARSAGARGAAERLVARALGAGSEVGAFYRAHRSDPLLGPSLRAFRGLRVAGWADPWEALVSTVLCQQVNLAFAYSIRSDLAAAFGASAEVDGTELYTFPGPGRIAAITVPELLRFRLSRSKAETIARLAAAFVDRRLIAGELESLPDDAVVARLTGIKGIGTWTAETVLLRGLGRLDAFPAGDLGVVKYLAQGLLGRVEPATEPEMRRWAEAWRPYRGLALVYAYAELGRRRAAS